MGLVIKIIVAVFGVIAIGVTAIGVSLLFSTDIMQVIEVGLFDEFGDRLTAGSFINPGFSLLDYIEFFGVTIAGFLAYFGFRQITTRSYSEKIDQELLSSIKLKEKQFRVQIKTVESDTEKEQLQQQILELRKGYQLLSGKILQNEDGGDVEDWRSVLLSARKRLLDEEDRLLANNKRNLGFALVIMAAGIFFLMYVANFIEFAPEGIADEVWENNDEQALESLNAWDFLVYYGPIFSILVLVQIPTFFFLRLYSSNERRLERNKSDLTNTELRLTSGLMLYEKVNKDNFAILADNLSKEDSNFVLGKNESSGGIDPSKLLEIIKAIK